jgi:YD repeat-containing protein
MACLCKIGLFSKNTIKLLSSEPHPIRSTTRATKPAGSLRSPAPPWAGVTSYASGIQYRAWGAPKAVSYGSGFSASAKYNVRMQVSEFDIPGVIGGTYTYNDDRQLSTFVASTTAQPTQYDTRMNRTFGYDQFGRLNSSVAGGSGFYATYNPTQDAFGNVTNAAYHYWQNGTTQTAFTAAYQNNRATSVTDAAQAQTWNYDAMGNRTSITKTVNGTPTTIESIQVDALGRGVGAILDGEGRAVVLGGGGNYYVRSTVFGGEVLTTLDNLGNKSAGRVLDGGNLIAEQLTLSGGGATTVRWHHRDPLNLVARDAEPGQVKRRVHAVTPQGAQIETSEGVNLNQYYACLLGGNNNPTCTGYTPQVASTYGYLADQANGMVGAGLKVDGVLTLWSLSDVARQVGRTGLGIINLSPALAGTPLGQGSFVSVWREGRYIDVPRPGESEFRIHTDYVEGHFEFLFVPGGQGQGYVPKIDHLPTTGAEFPERDYSESFYPIINDFLNNQDCVAAFKKMGVDLITLLTGNGIRIGPAGLIKH